MPKILPKMGDVIPVEKFHVSEMNVRAEEPFGSSEKDKALLSNLRAGKIIGPFKARPERKGYGIVVGRRRFLAKKEVGVESFTVGVDVLVEEMTDEEARESSLIENLEILREEMDPITRAKRLNEIVSSNPAGLRGTARRLGISASTLSEWLKVLDLSSKMQEAVSKGKLFYTDALQVSRMNLGEIAEEKLAATLETEGVEAFQKDLERLAERRLKRGIPKGKYIILRTTFDRAYPPDLELYEKLSSLAKTKHMEIDAYCKWVLQEHVKIA